MSGMSESSSEDDSFFDFCVQDDQESLRAIESVIAALDAPIEQNPGGIQILDANSESVQRQSFDLNISSVVKSSITDNPLTEVKSTLHNPQIRSVRDTLFRQREVPAKSDDKPHEVAICHTESRFQSRKFRLNVVLPIVLLGQDRTTVQFFTALRVVGPCGKDVQGLVKQQFLFAVRQGQTETLKLTTATILAQGQLAFLLDNYAFQSSEIKCSILTAMADYFETQNYFATLPICTSESVASYMLQKQAFVINSDLVRMYEQQQAALEPESTEISGQKVEQFFYVEIKKETDPQIFCQLLACLKAYTDINAIASEDRYQKLLKMLLAQFSRINSFAQQTSLLIGFLNLLVQKDIQQPILERFLAVILQQKLSPQSRRAILLYMQKVAWLPEISTELQKRLIQANYSDFFIFFTKTREFLFRQIELGKKQYYMCIDHSVTYNNQGIACRLFATLLVQMQAEKSFLGRLRYAEIMQKLQAGITSPPLAAQFNQSKILAHLHPRNAEECAKIFRALQIKDLACTNLLPEKTALLIAQYLEQHRAAPKQQI